jgi:hypothetical protein
MRGCLSFPLFIATRRSFLRATSDRLILQYGGVVRNAYRLCNALKTLRTMAQCKICAAYREGADPSSASADISAQAIKQHACPLLALGEHSSCRV